MPESDVHSNLGASSSHRWMNCPGSVRLYDQLPERHATEYAATGTVAHALCEESLLSGRDPSVALGQIRQQDGFNILVTDDMVQAVSVYVDYIRHDLEKYGGQLSVEQYFDLSWVHPGMFGRNDACIVPELLFGKLLVYDYKNGRKLVAADANPQLMYYSLGALGQHNHLFVEYVDMTIIQPNGIGKNPIDVWGIATKPLYEWAMDVLRPAAKATEAPDAPCIMGEWCTFCEAAAICPAKQDAALALLDPPRKHDQLAVLPVVSAIPPEKLGILTAFFTSEEFQAWVKALAAEEQAALARGVIIPGRKLVESVAQGNRKWKDEEAVTRAFAEFGEDVFNIKLKSPAQLTSVLTKAGVSRAEATKRVNELTTRDEIVTVKVVNEDDPRPTKNSKLEALSLFDDETN